MDTSMNPNFFVEAFNAVVSSSQILKILFLTIISLVVFLYVITIARLYSKKMLGEELKISEMLRPFAVLLIIVFWKWIYFNILVGGFDYLMTKMSYEMDRQAGKDQQDTMMMAMEAVREGSISFMDISIEVLIMSLIKVLFFIINVILDCAVAVYVGVNDLILGIIAPIAIGFMMLEETKDVFVKWLKYFFLFRVFLLMVLVVNQLANSIFASLVSVMTKAMAWTTASAIGVTQVAVFAFIIYVLFKILFMMSSYKLLSSLFVGGEGGPGIGGAASSMTTAMSGGFSKVQALGKKAS